MHYNVHHRMYTFRYRLHQHTRPHAGYPMQERSVFAFALPTWKRVLLLPASNRYNMLTAHMAIIQASNYPQSHPKASCDALSLRVMSIFCYDSSCWQAQLSCV